MTNLQNCKFANTYIILKISLKTHFLFAKISANLQKIVHLEFTFCKNLQKICRNLQKFAEKIHLGFTFCKNLQKFAAHLLGCVYMYSIFGFFIGTQERFSVPPALLHSGLVVSRGGRRPPSSEKLVALCGS